MVTFSRTHSSESFPNTGEQVHCTCQTRGTEVKGVSGRDDKQGKWNSEMKQLAGVGWQEGQQEGLPARVPSLRTGLPVWTLEPGLRPSQSRWTRVLGGVSRQPQNVWSGWTDSRAWLETQGAQSN